MRGELELTATPLHLAFIGWLWLDGIHGQGSLFSSPSKLSLSSLFWSVADTFLRRVRACRRTPTSSFVPTTLRLSHPTLGTTD